MNYGSPCTVTGVIGQRYWTLIHELKVTVYWYRGYRSEVLDIDTEITGHHVADTSVGAAASEVLDTARGNYISSYIGHWYRCCRSETLDRGSGQLFWCYASQVLYTGNGAICCLTLFPDEGVMDQRY